MTGGGDTDEFEPLLDEADDVGDEEDDVASNEDDDVDLDENDDDPTAGASDIGGRAGDPNEAEDAAEGDLRGEDQHEVGGGQTGMGKGPTGS